MPKYNSPSITTLALTTASQLSKIQIKASHLCKETFTFSLDATSIDKAVSDSYISSPFFSKTYPIFICSQATGSGVSKEMGKKYILILWQVQTIMKAHKWTHYRDKQIMRNISPKGGLYVIVPAFIIQGRVWRGGQKEVKYQEAQCESVS